MSVMDSENGTLCTLPCSGCHLIGWHADCCLMMTMVSHTLGVITDFALRCWSWTKTCEQSQKLCLGCCGAEADVCICVMIHRRHMICVACEPVTGDTDSCHLSVTPFCLIACRVRNRLRLVCFGCLLQHVPNAPQRQLPQHSLSLWKPLLVPWLIVFIIVLTHTANHLPGCQRYDALLCQAFKALVSDTTVGIDDSVRRYTTCDPKLILYLTCIPP